MTVALVLVASLLAFLAGFVLCSMLVAGGNSERVEQLAGELNRVKEERDHLLYDQYAWEFNTFGGGAEITE